MVENNQDFGLTVQHSTDDHNLQRQNNMGINAPMAIKTGSMIEESSSVYGSGVFGPLGLRLDVGGTGTSSTSSRRHSSSVCRGGSFGISEGRGEKTHLTLVNENL